MSCIIPIGYILLFLRPWPPVTWIEIRVILTSAIFIIKLKPELKLALYRRCSCSLYKSAFIWMELVFTFHNCVNNRCSHCRHISVNKFHSALLVAIIHLRDLEIHSVCKFPSFQRIWWAVFFHSIGIFLLEYFNMRADFELHLQIVLPSSISSLQRLQIRSFRLQSAKT